MLRSRQDKPQLALKTSLLSSEIYEFDSQTTTEEKKNSRDKIRILTMAKRNSKSPKRNSKSPKRNSGAPGDKEEEEYMQANAEVEQILGSTKPKHIGEGLSSGLGYILRGAVGACGALVVRFEGRPTITILALPPTTICPSQCMKFFHWVSGICGPWLPEVDVRGSVLSPRMFVFSFVSLHYMFLHLMRSMLWDWHCTIYYWWIIQCPHGSMLVSTLYFLICVTSRGLPKLSLDNTILMKMNHNLSKL
jgi:hypothetical protein